MPAKYGDENIETIDLDNEEIAAAILQDLRTINDQLAMLARLEYRETNGQNTAHADIATKAMNKIAVRLELV